MMGLIESILILLLFAVIAIMLFKRLNLPPVLGYLLVGVILGPHALDWLRENTSIHLLSEIGLIFLLFGIGLEFSIHYFWEMRRSLITLGGLQMVLSASVGGAIAWWSGLTLTGAIVAGGALAMSSTAIVIKQIDEQRELHSRHGRLVLGVLLFQDLAVVPFLIAIPIFASHEGMVWQPFAMALIKGMLAFAMLLAIGRWVLRPWFRMVAGMRSAELFTLNVLFVALAAAWMTYALGLSLVLGAFLAGLMLSETEFRHQIETEIRSFRDILMGLFFMVVGMHLNLGMVLSQWIWVFSLLAGLIIGKGILVMFLARWVEQDWGVALRTGISLAQGGEFGLALIALGLSRGLLDSGSTQVILAAMIFSMALAPIMIRYNGILAKKLFAKSYLKKRFRKTRELNWAAREYGDHVILCGFGRVGQNLARFLNAEGLPYVALDLDPYIIREAWEAGESVFYGDSTHGEILQAAGLRRARAIVITFEAIHLAERIISEVRRRSPKIAIFVRTHDETDLDRLYALGATHVIPEAVESSLLIARLLLEVLDIPFGEIDDLLERERQNRYRQMQGRFRGEYERLQQALHTVVIPSDSQFIGQPLGALNLDAQGIKIEALRRKGIRGEFPDEKVILQMGDVLVLKGEDQRLLEIEKQIVSGSRLKG